MNFINKTPLLLYAVAALAVIATMDEIPHHHHQQQQQQQQHELCGYFASRALCYYAFPLCRMTRAGAAAAVPTPRRLCRADCEALKTDVCRTLYELAKTHPAIGE